MLPVHMNDNLTVMSIGFLLPNANEPVIWRGPRKFHLIRQFLTNVAWGNLDYLVVDSPPGTGDEPMSVAQLVGSPAEAVIVIVCVPSGSVSSTARISNGADVVWPSGIVMDSTTVACDGSLLVRATVKSPAELLRVTVPWDTPPVSHTESGSSDSVRMAETTAIVASGCSGVASTWPTLSVATE